MGTSSETKQIVSNPYVINIDRNLIFSAKIETVYIITVQQPENGSITVNGEVGTTFMYSEGTPITIQAVPNENYECIGLYVDNSDVPITISFTLTGDLSGTFEAEIGMTWQQWINSSYNTVGLESFSSYGNSDEYVLVDKHTGGYTSMSSLIVDGRTYDYHFENIFCCVPYYSKIYKQDGTDCRVEELIIGDIILGYDFNTNTPVYTEVLKISKPIRKHLCQITIENGSVMEITSNHVIYTDQGWAAYEPESVLEVPDAILLTLDQKALFSDNKYYQIIDIKINEYPETIQCYDLTTTTSNYFAEDFLVHNVACPT